MKQNHGVALSEVPANGRELLFDFLYRGDLNATNRKKLLWATLRAPEELRRVVCSIATWIRQDIPEKRAKERCRYASRQVE